MGKNDSLRITATCCADFPSTYRKSDNERKTCTISACSFECFDTCDHFSSFRAFHKFSRRNKFESIRTFVHSFRLYLRPGIYRGKTFLLALLIRSAERQMLNPYSLERKIFTEAFSSAENIRLFVEKVARNWSSRNWSSRLLIFTRDGFRCSFARRRSLKRGRSRRLD